MLTAYFVSPRSSNVNIILRELNAFFQPHDTACYAFYKQCVVREDNGCERELFKPCRTFDDVMQHSGDKCLIVGRNLTYHQTVLETARSLNLETKRNYFALDYNR